jgi:signal transduction histidine kinase
LGARRLRAGQWLQLSVGLLTVVALVGIGAAFLASHSLTTARNRIVSRIDPARVAAQALTSALLNQETGVRGFVIGGREEFLRPYLTGRSEADRDLARLDTLSSHGDLERLRSDLVRLRAAVRAWQHDYAEPTVARVRRSGSSAVDELAISEGASLFDRVRSASGRLNAGLAQERLRGRADLRGSAHTVTLALILASALLLAGILVSATVMRSVMTVPVAALRRRARAATEGDFRRPIEASGARDIVDLGEDVEALRRRIVRELETIEEARERIAAQAVDLQRSNLELEQFAYVASHDLQEPLRKVTSFCQMLEKRYSGQLDERADQYIHYAVDGAKRMQVLINDLLAFSRVGRLETSHADVDTGEVVREALENLAQLIEDSDARVDVAADLPVVLGDRSLLRQVFQNLVANGIKFRGERPPHIRISARRDGDEHVISVADNGIGVDPQYGERIFVIFQRLHTKDAYEGTGIGLAMCRKIVEHHGGRIWLSERKEGEGATFCFTLPALDTTAAAPTDTAPEGATTA